MAEYLQYTYPRWLQNHFCWWLWQRFGCRHGWHLWVEVSSSTGCHYLICDACSEIAHLGDCHEPDCRLGTADKPVPVTKDSVLNFIATALFVNSRHGCSCEVCKE